MFRVCDESKRKKSEASLTVLRHRDGEKLPRVEHASVTSSARGRQGCGGCASGRAATVARGRVRDGARPGASGTADAPHRGRSSAVLLAALLSIHCAAMGAAPAETELTAGVAVNGTTAKNEAAFFHFTLAPYEDAVLTLTMLDGDADVYVLGPSYSRQTGFGPGPKGAVAVNADHFGNDDNFNRYDSFWSSYESAGTDEVLYISSSDDPIRVGSVDTSRTFRVGVWGWSRWGELGARGSAWSVSFEPEPRRRGEPRGPKSRDARRVRRVLRRRLRAHDAHDAVQDWRDRDDTTVPMDACHVRGNVCGERRVVDRRFAEFNMTCDLGALVVALAPVLGSVTRFDVSANPSLTTGRADVSAWPTAARTPAGTLAALLRATAPNVTHLHLEANVFVRRVRVGRGEAGARTRSRRRCARRSATAPRRWLRSKRAQSG